MKSIPFLLLILLIAAGCSTPKYEISGVEIPHGDVKDVMSTPCGIFPGGPTPLQIAIGPWGIFDPVDTTVYGLSLNLTKGKLQNCYGISVAPLMNAHENMYGLSAGLINVNYHTHGLSVGVVNVYEINYGVSIGVYNLKLPKEEGKTPKMNFLQIGVINLAESGLQFGLLNCNESAKIRILPLFNYSPFPERSVPDNGR